MKPFLSKVSVEFVPSGFHNPDGRPVYITFASACLYYSQEDFGKGPMFTLHTTPEGNAKVIEPRELRSAQQSHLDRLRKMLVKLGFDNAELETPFSHAVWPA